MHRPGAHVLAPRPGELFRTGLAQTPFFPPAPPPHSVSPPLFNRYQGGHSVGTHVDTAIRPVTGTTHRIRTDLSATLFFAEPHEDDGGELVVEDTYGVHHVKLPAGHLVLYPASSLHHVCPVTRARIASFFWIQSMVRDDAERALLLDLDMAIQRINRVAPDPSATVRLTGVYHNLLRRWADLCVMRKGREPSTPPLARS